MILTETKISNSNLQQLHTYFTVHYYCTYIYNVCVVLYVELNELTVQIYRTSQNFIDPIIQ